MSRSAAPLLPCLSSVLLAGCVSLNYVRFLREEPVPPELTAGLRPGIDDLTSCLQRLGAPTWVWRSETGEVKLAYGWVDRLDWGIDVAWALEQHFDVSFEWDSVDVQAEGVVLIFDRSMLLRDVAQGFLRELLPSNQRVGPARRANRAPS